jgi:hypothetical protein
MSVRAKKTGLNKMAEKRKELMELHWGADLDNLPLWDRRVDNGFSTVPRTLPYICRVLDRYAEKGKPLSQTYIALWCRMSDEGLIEIREKEALAYESGFSGPRALTTWAGRMRVLFQLGFIDCRSGTSGEFHYTLMLHPLKVIKNKYDGNVLDDDYRRLVARMSDVGASWE